MALYTDGMWMATSWSLLLILAIITSEPLLMVFEAIAWWTPCMFANWNWVWFRESERVNCCWKRVVLYYCKNHAVLHFVSQLHMSIVYECDAVKMKLPMTVTIRTCSVIV